MESREQLHNLAVEYSKQGMSHKDAFIRSAFKILPNIPFKAYVVYRVWKHKNNIIVPSMFKCGKCNCVNKRTATTQKYCYQCVPKFKGESNFKTFKKSKKIIEDQVFREAISGRLSDIENENKLRVQHQNNIKQINYSLLLWKDCKSCGDFFKANNIGQSHCSTYCQVYSKQYNKVNRIKDCAHCAGQYYKEYGHVGIRGYCSSNCLKSAQRKQYRVYKKKYHKKYGQGNRARCRKHGKVYHTINRLQVFNDDNYTCYLCGIKCSKEITNHNDSPTIEHLVPLSDTSPNGMMYGHHIRANVRCACRGCNTAKGINSIQWASIPIQVKQMRLTL